MIRLFILFALIFPAYAGPAGAPALKKERAALLLLEEKFNRFQKSERDADLKFAKMRLAVIGHHYKEARDLAEELTKIVRTSRRQWREIETFYTDNTARKLDFQRQTLAKRLDLEPGLINYLAFRKHNRRGYGTPMELQLAAWRGLHIGNKLESPPSALRRTLLIEDLRVRAGDSLLIMTTNGGLVRGRLEGMSDGNLVLLETLPNTLAIIQRTQGHYRILDLTDAARIEIISLPKTVQMQETPQAMVTLDGEYSGFFVKQDLVTRVDFRPDDVELLDLVKEGRFAEIEHPPRISMVNLEQETRPAFSSLFFYDCEGLLNRR